MTEFYNDHSKTHVIYNYVDNEYLNIAAASILAKVERDKYMENLSTNYDKYEFKNNKGYWI